MQHIDHIKVLKKRLKTGKKFGEIADYFLTHLGEDKSFLKACEPLQEKNEFLYNTIGKMSVEVLPDLKPPLAMAFLLHKFSDSEFIHGTVFIKHHLVNVIYYEKSYLGLLMYRLSGDMMHFCRITALPVGGKHGMMHYGNVLG